MLLVGFADRAPQGAWAAGLRGESEHPHFVTFARFMLRGHLACNAYWLFLPEVFEDCLGYRLTLRSRRGSWEGAARLQAGDAWVLDADAEGCRMDDLLVPGAHLPGLMRRDLLAMAAELEVDPPAQ